MMGAIGSWLGVTQGLRVLVCVAISGIILSLGAAWKQKRLHLVVTNMLTIIYGFLFFMVGRAKFSDITKQVIIDNEGNHLTIPYGVAIFVGVCGGGGVVWLW